MALAGAPPSTSVHEVARLLLQIACNALEVTDADLQPRGLAFYPFAALLQHSDRQASGT